MEKVAHDADLELILLGYCREDSAFGDRATGGIKCKDHYEEFWPVLLRGNLVADVSPPF